VCFYEKSPVIKKRLSDMPSPVWRDGAGELPLSDMERDAFG